jgi:lysophospholipase L1-like esterase
VKRTLALLVLGAVAMALAPPVSAVPAQRPANQAVTHAQPVVAPRPKPPPPLPDSVAVIGDSISQAFDSECCLEQPQHSWATGDDGGDGIASHYERILAANPAIAGHNFNDSVTGSRMSDAAGQAAHAVAQGAQYVIIEMGGNDLCTSSASSMTSVADYTSQFRATLQTLESGLPQGSHIFVASIPNIYRLWQIFHTDPQAELVWQIAGICQSMLAIDNSSADRQLVVQREAAFNKVLRKECKRYSNCKYDKGAVFGFAFGTGDVDHIDYFHPSIQGQAAFAARTWPKSWWPET